MKIRMNRHLRKDSDLLIPALQTLPKFVSTSQPNYCHLLNLFEPWGDFSLMWTISGRQKYFLEVLTVEHNPM